MKSMDRGEVTVLFFHFLLMISVATGRDSITSTEVETEALSLFRNQADVHGHLSGNWTGDDACRGHWIGVGCSSSRSVITSLSLPNLQLRGTLGPSTLSRLSRLRLLDLRNNRLNGTLLLLLLLPSDPDSSPFRRLKLLYLSGNDLAGPIPVELGQLTRLVRLDLSHNDLSGPILPSSFSSSLLTLRLQDNLLTGTLPDLTSSLPLLRQFNASNNHLHAPLPPPMLRRFGISAFLCGPNCSLSQSSVVPSNPSSMPANSTGNGEEMGTKRSKTIILISLGNGVFLLLLILFFAYFRCCSSASHFGVAGKDRIGKVGVAEEEYSAAAAQIVDRGGDGKRNTNPYSSENASDTAAEEGESKLVFFQQQQYENRNSSDSGGSSTGSSRRRRRRRKQFDEFGLEELLRASAEMLGKGSLGTVYRAVLEDGSMVAVKRLRDANPCRRKDFHEYMDLIGRLAHPNIVPLKAYYFAKQEKLLIYPYIPGGNLYTLLHGNRGGPGRVPLNWTMRMRLILGAARGLAHIHEEYASSRIPHGNIKSANVLANNNNNKGKLGVALISDFGLALLLDPVHAIARLGGYTAPEQQPRGDQQLLSQEADVYSFGVVLLELLTGRAPLPIPIPNKNNIDIDIGEGGLLGLVEWVKSVVSREWTEQVFDTELMRYKGIQEEMVAMLHVGLACVAHRPDSRPSMAEVVKMIEDVGSPLSEEDEYLDGSRVSLSPSPPATNMEGGRY